MFFFVKLMPSQYNTFWKKKIGTFIKFIRINRVVSKLSSNSFLVYIYNNYIHLFYY